MNRTNLIVGMVVVSCYLSFAALSADSGEQPVSARPPKVDFPDLPTALKNSPGCLGIELAKTTGGKDVVFAWFENKKAVETWYNSDVHQQSMRRFFPGSGAGKPLAGVPDDVGPILAIASITMSREPKYDDVKLPISQLSIELYTPLKGGLFLGETFAPKGLKVKDMADYTLPDSTSAAGE